MVECVKDADAGASAVHVSRVNGGFIWNITSVESVRCAAWTKGPGDGHKKAADMGKGQRVMAPLGWELGLDLVI